MKNSIKLLSLFSGAGGLDLGFETAGFHTVWANEYDSKIWETYKVNFPNTVLDKRSIVEVKSHEIPEADGIIGGPPCQSWSLAGSMKGTNDNRGKLFYEYVRVLRDKQPKFFLAENVPGIISKTHLGEFQKIIQAFEDVGYTISYQKVAACDYGVPQERQRVVIVGVRKDLKKKFIFPVTTHGSGKHPYKTLKDTIGDMPEPMPALAKNKTNGTMQVSNHEYFTGSFSPRFMSRNRIRGWSEASFTIEASGRHAKLHPSSPPMRKLEQDLWEFTGDKKKYRRLSVRESARIQSFPDSFIFRYTDVNDGYKMIGNAVPVQLAHVIAKEILSQIFGK